MPSCTYVDVWKMGVTMAPVDGSGSWPAWMQSVAMPMLIPRSRLSDEPSLYIEGPLAHPADRRPTVDLPQPPRPGQELPAFRRRQRPREQEPLHAVALSGGQELELLLALHALRHHPQLQGVRERDDGGGDGGVVGVARDVAHEGLIDLEGVDGQALEIAQRRVADPEVVDGDADPQRLE